VPSVRMALHPVHGPGLAEGLAALPHVDLVTAADDAGVAEAIGQGASALVTYRWDDSFLVEGLEWVQAISAGFDQFPLAELARRGVMVTSARGAHSPAVAEHALALLLALLRGVGRAVHRSADRRWKAGTATEIGGLTVAVLGLGAIGEEFAIRAKALGARVIGMKRSPEGYSGVADTVVGPDRLRWLLEEADAAVSFLPSGDDTRRLLGPAELALLAGWLVNVGRGDTVDEAGLVDAIREGRLEGAALDVTDIEPLPHDSPLWDLEEVIITPTWRG
jgi:D-2-hydroxyacid dehydrogenase (NADP+)